MKLSARKMKTNKFCISKTPTVKLCKRYPLSDNKDNFMLIEENVLHCLIIKQTILNFQWLRVAQCPVSFPCIIIIKCEKLRLR